MELGVVSDTHDNLDAANAAVEAFQQRGIDTVLHCGDFVAPPLVSAAFGGTDLTLHGVLGNNDGELDGLERTIDGLGSGSRLHGRYAALEFDGLTVRLLHGDQGMDAVESEAQSGAYDVVCYGHFHVSEHREVKGTQVVNPGAHFPTVPEDHRRVAVLDTADASVEFVSL